MTSPKRNLALPDVPTMVEQGVQGLDIVGWQGIFGPGHMAPATAQKISAILAKIVRSPEMLKLIEAQGIGDFQCTAQMADVHRVERAAEKAQRPGGVGCGQVSRARARRRARSTSAR